ncbi:MAG: Methylaspartate ammonia-lyase [Anaerospora sp.]|nr:Methylaspartate ammonia-lyase [Anaerospora sp.]
MLVLEDGQVAYGDCAAVQYSGAGGRDPVFLADDFIPVVEKLIKPQLVNRELNSFKVLAEEVDNLIN